MSVEKKNLKQSIKAANAGLGRKGVALTLYCGVLAFMCNSMGTGLTNTMFRPISEAMGWDYATMIGMNTYAGWLGVLTAILFGQLLLKKGARFVSALGLFVAAVGIWLFGHSDSFWLFSLAIVIDRCAATAYDKNAGVALINNWFPTRKGLVLGWSTMGVPLINIIFIPFVTWGTQCFGFTKVTTIIAAIFLLLGIVTILFVKNTPEECGAYPDNLPTDAKNIRMVKTSMENYQSPWTFKKLLMTKNVWIMSFGMGLMWLAVIGVVCQDIPRMISLGYSVDYATMVLLVCAFISMGGSYVWGLVDQLIGTKKALIAFGIFFIFCLCLYLLQPFGTVFVWISVASSMFCVGGIPNLVPSMVGTVFGRYDFAAANRVISPICNLLFSCAYLVVSRCLKIFGSYTQVYIILIGIALIGVILMHFTSDVMVGKVIREENK